MLLEAGGDSLRMSLCMLNGSTSSALFRCLPCKLWFCSLAADLPGLPTATTCAPQTCSGIQAQYNALVEDYRRLREEYIANLTYWRTQIVEPWLASRDTCTSCCRKFHWKSPKSSFTVRSTHSLYSYLLADICTPCVRNASICTKLVYMY